MRVAIGGFGAIGKRVARELDRGMPGLELVAVSARDHDKARAAMASFDRPVPVMALGKLSEGADVVVECAPAAVFEEVARPAVERGRVLIPASVGALLACPELESLAAGSGARIIVPSGALLGLDAVRAAAFGRIDSVKLITRKPPRGLAGAPHLIEQGIDVEALDRPLRVFKGCARDGVAGFPANVNVAAALSLAGIGAARTELEIWADPGLERNTQSIEVESESASFQMSIQNVPSEDNPRTGKLTALSVIATLHALVAPIKVGT